MLVEDRAAEANRRAGWACYFGTKRTLDAERLLTVELAVWLDEADVAASDGPLRQLIDAVLEDADPIVVDRTRRYVRHNLREGP